MFEGVVLTVPLVVELDNVEVYQVPHCLVDCDIGSMFVELLFEVGSLRAMGDNMIRNHFSQSYCEVYKPLFPSACLHSSIVLPVYVSSVKIVSKYEIAKSCSAGLSILFLCCWKLTVSKGTGKHFHSGLIVHFFHS